MGIPITHDLLRLLSGSWTFTSDGPTQTSPEREPKTKTRRKPKSPGSDKTKEWERRLREHFNPTKTDAQLRAVAVISASDPHRNAKAVWSPVRVLDFDDEGNCVGSHVEMTTDPWRDGQFLYVDGEVKER